MPAAAIAALSPTSSASRPHSAVAIAVAALVLTDQALSVRETRSGVICCSRNVATTGLTMPMLSTSPS